MYNVVIHVIMAMDFLHCIFGNGGRSCSKMV